MLLQALKTLEGLIVETAGEIKLTNLIKHLLITMN